MFPSTLRPLLCVLLLAPLAPRAWADDTACLPLLQQAQQMLVEAEIQAGQGLDAKAEGIAIRALSLIGRAYELCPNNRDAAGTGVLLAAFARDAAAGQAWLERYAERTPYGERDPQLHYLRAVVEVRLINRPDLGVRSLERMQALAADVHAQQRDALYYEALVGAGAALATQGRHGEALRMHQAAEALARRTGKLARARRARALQGMTLARAERHKEAAAIFAGLREEDPTNPAWPYQHGLMLAQLFDYDNAIGAYFESLTRQEGYQDRPEVLAELARARLRMGNCLRLKAGRMVPGPDRERLVESALEALQRYHKERPKDALGPLWIGVLYYEEKDRPLEALGWFEKAFALDPECPTTLDYMIQAHGRAGGPVPPDQPLPDEATMAAWRAKGEAWKKDRAENGARRDKLMDERTRRTGDPTGGCL